MFSVRLASRPFYKESFDNLIIRLSRIYDIVRTGGVRTADIHENAAAQHFVRKTTKYWVHPDNVTEVKCIILKYLPVLVFSSKGIQDANPAITSIYFDNDSFDLYQGRLEKTEGAPALRLRWYGGMDESEIFVERKTHHEDWTGESSVKERFLIKEKNVNAYLSGDYTVDRSIQKMRERGQKTENELEKIKQLADGIQDMVVEKHLQPMVRTFYNRTAFQLPGDARVRISLDTDLTMIREDNFDGMERAGHNWRRMDIGVDFPFSYLPTDDVSRFPYAILEVKLQTQFGSENPLWVEQLIASHLVEEVPKFSKFIHGISTLLESHVSLLPFWLPQMEKDIKKPAPEGYVSPLTGLCEGGMYDEFGRPERSSPRINKILKQIDHGSKVNSAVHINIESDEEEEDSEQAPLLRAKAQVKPFRLSSFFKQASSQQSSMQTASGLKRIVLPVRIEPKVFFANERTFLSWLHFCIVLGGLALGLLNFGDAVGQISGLVFTLVAMLFMLYALFLYLWRAHKIRNRGPYDDRYGPTVLVITLFFAVMTNFYLKFSGKS